MSVSNNLDNLNKDLQSPGYNLVERTTEFGKNILVLCKTLQQDSISKHLISQIVRSATSIGANYREANCAVSKKDFALKISHCRKECNETEHWLTILSTIFPKRKEELRLLWQENHELTMIFTKIYTSTRKNTETTLDNDNL